MDTYWLVGEDGTFFEEDGRTLFTLEEANVLARRGLAITPAFRIP